MRTTQNKRAYTAGHQRRQFERDHPLAIPMKQARAQIAEHYGIQQTTAHYLIHSGELPLRITRLNARVVYVEANH